MPTLYYDSDTASTATWTDFSGGNFAAYKLLTTTSAAATPSGSVPLSTVKGWTFTTDAGVPNKAAVSWEGTWNRQIDIVTNMASGSAQTTLNRIDSTGVNKSLGSSNPNIVGTGLKTQTNTFTSANAFASGATTTDRIGHSIGFSNTDMMVAATGSIRVNSGTSYVEAPWASGTAFSQTLPSEALGLTDADRAQVQGYGFPKNDNLGLTDLINPQESTSFRITRDGYKNWLSYEQATLLRGTLAEVGWNTSDSGNVDKIVSEDFGASERAYKTWRSASTGLLDGTLYYVSYFGDATSRAPFACQQGEVISAQLKVRAAAVVRSAQLRIIWIQSDGQTQIGPTLGAAQNDAVGSWTTLTVEGAVAPAGTAFAALEVRWTGAGVNEYHYLREAQIERSTTATAFTTPGNITDDVSMLRNTVRNPADEALGLTDVVNTLLFTQHLVEINENIGLTDEEVQALDGVRSLSEALGLTDSQAQVSSTQRKIVDAGKNMLTTWQSDVETDSTNYGFIVAGFSNLWGGTVGEQADLAWDATDSHRGSHCLKVTPHHQYSGVAVFIAFYDALNSGLDGIPYLYLDAGTYTFSGWFKGVAGVSYWATLREEQQDIYGYARPGNAFTATGEWEQLVATITLPKASGFLGFLVREETAVPSGSPFRLDEMQFEKGNTATTWQAPGMLSDSASQVVNAVRSQDDNEGLSDSTVQAVGTGYEVAPQELIGLADVAAQTVNFPRSQTDSSGLTDNRTQVFDSVQSQTDSEGLTDNRAQVLSAAQSQSELVGLTDAASQVVGSVRSQDDNNGLTDNRIQVSDSVRSRDDNVGLTDSRAQVLDSVRSRDDSLGATDAAVSLVGTEVAQSEFVGLTDSSAQATTSSRSQDDNVGLLDNRSQVSDLIRTQDDPEGITDSRVQAVDSIRSQNDSFGTTDSAVQAVDFPRSQTDNVGLLDNRTQASDATRSQDDVVGLTDNRVVAIDVPRFITDSQGLLDALTQLSDLFRPQTDSVGLSDSASLASSYVRSRDDSEGLSDTASLVSDQQRSSDDALGLVDISAQISDFVRTQNDSEEIVDEYSQFYESFGDVLIDDSLGLTDLTDSASATQRALSDPEGLTDTRTLASSYERSQSDTEGATDQISQASAAQRVQMDSLGLSDVISTTQNFVLVNLEALGLSDSISTAGAFARLVSDSQGISDTLLQVATYLAEITDTIAESDVVTYGIEWARELSEALGVTDAVISYLAFLGGVPMVFIGTRWAAIPVRGAMPDGSWINVKIKRVDPDTFGWIDI